MFLNRFCGCARMRRDRRSWRRFCGRFGRMGWGVGRGSFATSFGKHRVTCGLRRIQSIRCWNHRRCVVWSGRWYVPVCHVGCAILLRVLLTVESRYWYFAECFAFGCKRTNLIYKEDGIGLIIQMSNRLTAHSTEYSTAWPLIQSDTQAIDWLVEVLTNQDFNQSTG